MSEQWAAPMGRLSRNDEHPADHTGQAARDKIGRSGRELETDDGKVPASGDGAGGKGRLRDRPTYWGSGSGDRGRNTCNARPLGGTLSGRGMGFYPN